MDGKLETLLMVAETKNFTRAAKTLHMTQPSVSHHISALEQEFGVSIFVRGKGNIQLTPEGEIVVRYARRMMTLYQRIRQELRDETEQMKRLIIGIAHTAESNMIAEALAKYGRDSQGVTMTILSNTINNLYDMILNYDIDLAIVEGRIISPEINSILLDTDYLVCVVSPQSPLAQKNMVTLHDIQKEKMILRLPTSGNRKLFLSHLESINMSIEDLDIILEVDNIATIKELVQKDIGISILARSACLDEFKKGKMVALPIENLSMVREVNILYHKDFTHIDVLRDITKTYREAMRRFV